MDLISYFESIARYILENYGYLFPFLVSLLGFLETVGFFGYFIPLELIFISYIAFLHKNLFLLIISFIFFFIGIILGLLVGYLIGRFFYEKFLNLINKIIDINKYLIEIDNLINKKKKLSFIFLINIGFTRPIMGIYFGGRKFLFKNYLVGIFLAGLSYVIPRFFIGIAVGYFGKFVLDYFQIGVKYILYVIIFIIIIAFIIDILEDIKKR